MPTSSPVTSIMISFIVRFILIFSISLWTSSFMPQGFASTLYTPGATIGMTGSTIDSRFDVSEVLYSTLGNNSYNPILNTATRTFSWAFYVLDIWWIEFNTGSYQVSLDCGAQILWSLVANCKLSGTGWSENVWEVDFHTIQYIPSSGILSGSIATLAGDFSLSGTFLPLRPSILHENLGTLTANTQVVLSVSWAQEYAGSIWSLQYTPKINPFPQLLVGSSTGYFIADISYADDYTFTVNDPDGWTTSLDATIHPWEVNIGSFDASNNYIHQFCFSYPGNCPDGNIPIQSSKIQNGANIVGDGNNLYQVTIKPRDRFWNRVYTGSTIVSYDATVNSIQIPVDTLGPVGWIASFTGDALIFSGEVFIPDFSNHLWKTPSIQLSGQDITYTIASVVPTDASHQVILKDITYTQSNGLKIVSTDINPLVFLPAFDSSMTPPASIKIGEDSLFQVNTTKNTGLSFIPYIISAFGIGNGANASFQNFQSNESIACEAHPPMSGYAGTCDWIESQSFWNPSIASIHSSSTSYSITGSYIPMSADPPEESISYANYIHYTIADLGNPLGYFGSSDIAYISQSGNLGNSIQEQSNIVILWQNNTKRHDGISISKSERANLLDTVRKNSAISSRNRTTYNDVSYTIHQGNLSIDNTSFTGKRSIVVIWGDITITSNIAMQNSALAIIALADTQGNGGNIIIDPSVTDIHATMIAEHSLLTNGDRQLYIHGSLITANTYGGTAAHICPYYITVACTPPEAKKYDMEKMRLFDGSDSTKKALAPTAGQYPTIAIVIEYDIWVEQNPPPILR